MKRKTMAAKTSPQAGPICSIHLFFYAGKWPYTLWCNTNGAIKGGRERLAQELSKEGEKRT